MTFHANQSITVAGGVIRVFADTSAVWQREGSPWLVVHWLMHWWIKFFTLTLPMITLVYILVQLNKKVNKFNTHSLICHRYNEGHRTLTWSRTIEMKSRPETKVWRTASLYKKGKQYIRTLITTYTLPLFSVVFQVFYLSQTERSTSKYGSDPCDVTDSLMITVAYQ